MEPAALRMLDANANRAREALRVMEDYARFVMNDQSVSAALKGIRHNLAEAVAEVPDAILARDVLSDAGVANKTESEFTRTDLGQVVVAAGKRLSEALRVIEEILKIESPKAAAVVEKMRYSGYYVEQMLAGVANQQGRFASVRLYVLITESLCRNHWQTVLGEILTSTSQPKGSPPILAVQLREKQLDGNEALRRAKILVEACKTCNAISIINDRPDIAALAGADGVHLGQQDLPPAEARKILGSRAILGVSTENLAQARQAVADGATYIGVGPMFPTTTKEKPRLAGPAYAAEAVAQIPIPSVAIGGINPQNVTQLKSVGIKCVAVCSAIISDPDPAARTRDFLAALA